MKKERHFTRAPALSSVPCGYQGILAVIKLWHYLPYEFSFKYLGMGY